MIPEYGHFALILALCLALLQSAVPLWGALTGNHHMMAISRSLAAGQFTFIAIAFAVLSYLFLHDDFTVKVVAAHSNSQLPWMYKLSAVWGNHEGSLLLWVLILSLWGLAVAMFGKATACRYVGGYYR